MSQKDIGNKIPIYKLKTTEEVMKYYDEWGEKDKYNKDMLQWNYTGPEECVETLSRYQKNKDILIFDAGCGTGLVGIKLKRNGFINFHGADLSQTLLDSIPKDLYQKLEKADLNKPIQIESNLYDVIMCVGTFTFGHVKPIALDEFVRITKPGGLICFTINEGIYEDYGFDKKISDLKENNKWHELEFFKSEYIASKNVNAWLGLYKVI
tara:strand:+ start:33 stop:659 length:627 start_codon:yes stop_codon:yes gene_type:complete